MSALTAAQEYHSAYADWIQAGKDGRVYPAPNLVEIIQRHMEEELRLVRRQVHDAAYQAHAHRIDELERRPPTPAVVPPLRPMKASWTHMSRPLAWTELVIKEYVS